MEVIKVGVGDEHEIDLRDIAQAQAGLTLAFHRTVPFGPVRIDDDGVSRELEEKGGVADPSDADAVGFGGGEDGFEDGAAHFPEHRWYDAMAQELCIPAGPPFLRSEAGVAVACKMFGHG